MATVVVILVVLVVGGIALLSYLGEKKRREAIARWATSNGWGYTAEDDRWADVWQGKPFGEGHTRAAENVLDRTDAGRRTVAFDYSYKETHSNGKTTTTTTYKFAVYATDLPAALPYLSVEPEGLWDKAVKLFGAEDLDLESDEFNRRYRVRASDPKTAYDVLNARTMEALLAVHGVDFRIQGAWIIAVERSELHADVLPARVEVLRGIVERVPSFVWSDHGAPGGGA